MSNAKKSPPKKSASTALAVRKAPKVAPAKEVVISGLPASVGVPVGQLGELATVGALGLVEVKFTPKEEAVLSEPVNETEILIKPDGTPYLPWAAYSRWFSRAFGRGGWVLVPVGKPQRVDNLVTMPYILYIHGQPFAFTYGEQDYYPDNKRQTWGDAVESTRGSGIRRCAKQLEVGLELWEKSFLAQWKAAHCLTVTVERQGKQKTEWRRKIDPPLPGEKIIGSRRTQAPADDTWDADIVNEREAAGRPVSSQLESPVITPQQLGRIAQIVERTQRNPAEVTLYLKKNFNVPRASKLLQKDYAKVCRDLEAKGDLPLPGDGHQ